MVFYHFIAYYFKIDFVTFIVYLKKLYKREYFDICLENFINSSNKTWNIWDGKFKKKVKILNFMLNSILYIDSIHDYNILSNILYSRISIIKIYNKDESKIDSLNINLWESKKL